MCDKLFIYTNNYRLIFTTAVDVDGQAGAMSVGDIILLNNSYSLIT